MEDYDSKYYIEKQQIIDDKDSEYNYEIIPSDDVIGIPEGDDDLTATVRVLQEAAEDIKASEAIALAELRARLTTRAPTVDDFIRSFLLRLGLNRTLDCFQVEWFERSQKGLLRPEDVTEVPDIYVRNQQLDDELQLIRQDRDKYKAAAMKAREMYIKLRNERDYHRLQHRRVAQEKNKLLNDLKRVREHYSTYEPALQQLRQKYEVAMKEKMLSQLERDRAMGQVQGLRSTLRSLEQLGVQQEGTMGPGGPFTSAPSGQTGIGSQEAQNGGNQRISIEERRLAEAAKDVANQGKLRNAHHPNDSEIPIDNGINPLLGKLRAPPGHLTRAGGFKLANTINAHEAAVSSLALLCPSRGLLCTTSDDNTWKLWTVPTGELHMTGTGHNDWVSSADFHAGHGRLATGSGDTTIKIWDYTNARCVHTFAEHGQAVWSVSWHWMGRILASSSLDRTVKVWDLGSQRCRDTLRGHSDSVNSAQFVPSANVLVSASADKTLALWDVRTGLCGQTLLGHQHSVNHAAFNQKGDTIVSCDSFGFVRFWDVRQPIGSLAVRDLGPHPANHVTYDMSGSCVAVASNEGNVRMIDVSNYQVTSLIGHEDAVQACVFDPNGDFLVSGSSDLTVRIWS